MPLTVTVDEAIAQEVEARLCELADITVIRQRKDPEQWTPEDKQVVIVKRSPQRQNALDHPGNPPAIAYTVTINLRLHTFQSEREEYDAKDISISELVAYVMNGITDADLWYQWDGLAINTEFGSIDYITNDGGFDCAVIPLVITYRFSETNAFEVRV